MKNVAEKQGTQNIPNKSHVKVAKKNGEKNRSNVSGYTTARKHAIAGRGRRKKEEPKR